MCFALTRRVGAASSTDVRSDNTNDRAFTESEKVDLACYKQCLL